MCAVVSKCLPSQELYALGSLVDGILVVRPWGVLFKRATADLERVADGLRVVGRY